MNDLELDEMLNQWDTPPVPGGLRERLGVKPRKRRFVFPSWHLSKGLLAGGAIGAVMCFIGVAGAFPQVFVSSSPRFDLLSEILDYKDDGSSAIEEYRASTARKGAEIMLQRTFPDNWFMTLHSRLFEVVHRLIGFGEEPPPNMASDCSFPLMSVIGHETILNYRTIEQREVDQDGSRYTEWRSPDLDCIVMKYIAEKPEGNGQFHITRERRPMVVRINRAQ